MDEGYDLRLKSISECQQTLEDCINKLDSIQRTIDFQLETLKIRDIIWDLKVVNDELDGTLLFLKIRSH